MKLWLLRPRLPEGVEDEFDLTVYRGSPWNPWYDKAFGFVVRAETEQEARHLVLTKAGDEQRREYDEEQRHFHIAFSPWLDGNLSLCEELMTEGSPDTIMVDFHSA